MHPTIRGSSSMPTDPQADLAKGRDAYARRAWEEAWTRLAAADGAGELAVDDLWLLALSAFLTGRKEGFLDALERAHHAHLERGDVERAARCAFWLAWSLQGTSESARAGGWMARAKRLLEDGRDCVERGYLLLPEALMAMGAGDLDIALDRFSNASELAQRFGDRDLAALGAIGRGEALLRSGRSPDGMRLLDEALVSVTAGESSPVVAGVVYCSVIDACQPGFDLRRAREWTVALGRWCAGQPGLVPYRGQCLVHRAQILQVDGEWAEAMTEAQR
ncbi:MAG: hypothetical protein KY453_13100, partial [Gemmatimonadetes bacterium]|nr:hypothetical protein [Gemmatimonadota bacterium]